MVGALDVARDLGAKDASRVPMFGIALQLDGLAVLHGRDERARIGAVMRACAEHLVHWGLGSHESIGNSKPVESKLCA
jgi:hypothetical protein